MHTNLHEWKPSSRFQALLGYEFGAPGMHHAAPIRTSYIRPLAVTRTPRYPECGRAPGAFFFEAATRVSMLEPFCPRQQNGRRVRYCKPFRWRQQNGPCAPRSTHNSPERAAYRSPGWSEGRAEPWVQRTHVAQALKGRHITRPPAVPLLQAKRGSETSIGKVYPHER
jgi:hypothetical protein